MDPEIPPSPNGRPHSAGAGAAPELDAWFDSVEARLARERGFRAWLRERPTRLRWSLAISLIAMLILFEAQIGGAKVEGVAPWLQVALQVALVAWASRWLLAAPHSPRQSLLTGTAWVALLTPFAIAVLTGHAEGSEVSAAGLGLLCFAHGFLFSLPVMVFLSLLDRSERPSPRAELIKAGLVGIVGNLLLLWHCGSSQLLHLVVGHAAIGIGWGLAAWFRWTVLVRQP